jgi:hypothetical protein
MAANGAQFVKYGILKNFSLAFIVFQIKGKQLLMLPAVYSASKSKPSI